MRLRPPSELARAIGDRIFRRTARRLSTALNIADLREQARARLPRVIFDFIDRGSEDDVASTNNRAAFERIKLVPRTMAEVAQRDQSTTLFGKTRGMPLVIAPLGGASLVWREADLALARAAANAGIPLALSMSATVPMERIAPAAAAGFWMQTYIWSDRSLSDAIIARARAAGAEALVITVDAPVTSNREYNARNHFGNPFRLSRGNVGDVLTSPHWLFSVMGRDVVRGVAFANYPAGRTYSALAASLSWDDARRTRDQWPRRLIIKGILAPEDAVRAVDCGADAIVVSNHGGRMLDSAEASIDALPAVAAAVGGRATVLLDSGVRRGSDVVKALALGASAVMIGRAAIYGAAAGGEEGIARALTLFRREIDRTMAQIGCRTIAELNPSFVRRHT